MRELILALVETVWRLNGCWAEWWDPRDCTSSNVLPPRAQ